MSGSKQLRLVSFFIIFTVFFNLLFIGNSKAADPAPSLTINGPRQMSMNETKPFTASGGCGEPFIWSLSGGGNLSNTTGTSVDYTAPSTNPNCENNTLICVTDSAGQQTCMRIAINGIDGVAYEDKFVSGPQGSICGYFYGSFESCSANPYYCGPSTPFTIIRYKCNNDIYGQCTSGVCAYSNPGGVWEDKANCYLGNSKIGIGTPLGITDLRTDAQKQAGCCPAATLPPPPPPVTVAQCTTCDLDISNFTASPTTIDGNSGGTVNFSIGITSSRPYTWTATIKRKDDPNSPDILIAGGSAVGSTSLDVEWTVKDLLDKLIEPGTYTATLTAKTTDGYCTKSADTEIIIKGNPKTCPLKHPVGSSLELASGNLNHSQTLFSVPKSPLMSGFTLTYNSRDGYNEALGTGWSHNYNLILKYISTRNIYILMDSGGEKIALYNNGSAYSPDISPYPILIKNNDNTLTLTYKDGSVYNFNAQGKITAIADKNGNTVNFTYNSGSNLISIADQTGKTIILGYDANNRISSMADPNNNSYAFTYTGNTLTAVSSNNSLGTQTWQYIYDDKGFMLTKTDPQGNLFQYAYDANHSLRQTIDPQGRTINIQYDPGNKTTTVTEKDGGIWVYKYDPVLGTLTSKTDPVSGLASNVYDANRNLISRTEADGGTTTYTYDANGNQTSVTDPLGKTTTYTYNSLNFVASVTDPKGHVTQYGYDTSGNLTSVTDATNAVTRYQYDAKGNIIAITNPLGKTTSMTYDQGNNLLTVTDPTGGTVRTTYDNIGNMISQTDALGNVTTFQYNSLNQMTQITDPLGKVTRYTYDYKGNRLSATDPNSNTTQYVYDYNGQITQITDALNNITNMAYGQTGCSSCGSGVDKLTSLTDAKNQNTSYVYDEAGRLTREADPLGKITTYIYDSKGNLISRTNPDNKTTTFTYDLNNRLKQKTYSDGSITTFQYDNASNMTYAGNANIAYNFIYDAVNRITQITDSNGRTISYQYDAAGNRTSMITPDGKTIAYTYDFNNLLTRITTDLEAFTFGYDANNRRTTRTLPNGTTSTYSYDQASRLTSTQTTKNSATIDSVTYTLDNVGNRLTKTQNATAYSYTYDNIYRLTQAAPSTGTSETYTYDAVGNRLTKVPDTPPSINETTQYSYDDENRLTGVTITQGSLVKQLTFAYDPFGRRIRKTVSPSGGGSGEETTNYVYDGQNIILEYNQAGNITANYTHGPNIDEPLAVQQGINTYYYHSDGLGSITALTNTSGSIVQTYTYDSFGNMTANGSVSQPFTYTAREYDSETGMYFYRARYYDPKVGRFVTKDPIGFGGGTNFYTYVENNPVNGTDPYGLWVSYIHKNITRAAAIKLGCSKKAEALAEANAGVDNYQRPEDAYRHAMSNGNDPANLANDIAKYYNIINTGNSSCDLGDIAAALHAVQDSTTPAHSGFKPWSNRGWEYPKHFGDLFPRFKCTDAYNATYTILSGAIRRCPCFCE